MDFRRIQTVADLKALAAAGPPPADPDAFRRLVAEHGCRLEGGPGMLDLVEPLEEVAASPDHPAFAAATAALLADCLQGGNEPEGMALNYRSFGGAYVALAVRDRAAILAGFALVRGMTKAPLFDAPERDLCISTDPIAITAALAGIARAITEDEMAAISVADRGNDAERHLSELAKVIADQDCVMTGAQNWFPSEVVELVAHVPGSRGFIPATAILMATCIDNGDYRGGMEYRWRNIGRSYFDLPERSRAPVMAGFRHLYEVCEHWNPHRLAGYKRMPKETIAIPPAADAFLRTKDEEDAP